MAAARTRQTMTPGNHGSTTEPLPALRRYVPLLVSGLVLLTFLVIPLKIISYGYLPIFDDALRHAAKAVSGKPWSEILILDSHVKTDPHIGWHTLLRQIYLLPHCDTDTLVVISV